MHQANSLSLQGLKAAQMPAGLEMQAPKCESFCQGQVSGSHATKVRRAATVIGVAISMGAASLIGSNADPVFAASSESHGIPAALNNVSFSAAESFLAPKVAVSSPATSGKLSTSMIQTQLASPALKHRVKSGESIWKLARLYEINPEALAAANGLAPQSDLWVGQTIKVPTASVEVGVEKITRTIDELAQTYGVNQSSEFTPSEPKTAVESRQPEGELDASQQVDQVLQKQQNHLKAIRENPQNLSREAAVEPVASESNAASPVNRLLLAEAATSQEEKLAKSSITDVPQDLAQPKLLASQTGDALPTSNEVAANFTAPISIPVPLPETPGFARPSDKREEITSSTLINEAESTEHVISPADPLSGQRLETPLVHSSDDRGRLSENVTPEIPWSPTEAPSKTQSVTPTVQQTSQSSEQPVIIPVPTAEISTAKSQKIEAYPMADVPKAIAAKASSSVTHTISPAVSPAATYRVKRGDTLNAIARRYGVAKEILIRANKIRNPNLISVNQQLVIPNQTVPEETSLGRSLPKSRPVASVTIDGTLLPPESSINPEWKGDRREASTQLASQPRQQRSPHLPQLDGNTPDSATIRSRPQPDLIGAAPTNAQNYHRMLQTPIGEVVGPELPSLNSPNQHLPAAPSKFNGFVWPAKGVLTSGYGRRWGRMHKGIDIAAPIGTPIVAAAPGEVVSSGWNSGGYGNLVKVKHPDGSLTLYAHNSRLLVRKGQQVEQGQTIAEMGSTGYSTGPHLHFELHPKGKSAANPIAFLQKKK